jgi:CheY-like chemotaxis protein
MKQRVLFVDDDPRFLEGLSRVLHRRRDVWDMRFAPSAEEALDLLAEECFDVVVTDVDMPAIDGFSFILALRESEPTASMPIIALTGARQLDIEKRALEIGADYVCIKPVKREDLEAVIQTVCDATSEEPTAQAGD